jgi:mRNA interferase MazF
LSSDVLSVGDLILATLPEQVPSGREQKGYRPAIIVGTPETIGTPRYPMLLTIPLTTYRGQQWVAAAPDLYPVLARGVGSLPVSSIALLDQMRALDKTRIARYLGTLTREQYQPIVTGLCKMINPAELG